MSDERLNVLEEKLRALETRLLPEKEKEKEKKKKKSPSPYNIFIGNYLTSHRGQKPHKELFADATAAWTAQKASIDKKS